MFLLTSSGDNKATFNFLTLLLEGFVYTTWNVYSGLSTDNQRDLTDMLIACQQEEQKEGNFILKEMEETHYAMVLNDIIFGEYRFLPLNSKL